MAKYTVTFSCGHTETKDLLGPIAKRESYIAWANVHAVCSNCRSADKAAQVEATEAEHGVPALSGSPKQISWARTIRAEKLSAFAAYIVATRAKVVAGKEAEFEGLADVALVALVSKSESRWWIDNREVAIGTLASRAVKG